MQPGELTWVGAAAGHVAALQAFTCAEPPRARWDRLRRDHVRQLFRRAGFVYLEDDFEEPNLEYWMHDLL